MCVCVCVCVCVYVYISECVQILYELPLLQNNTVNETFLHTSGRARSVDWIFFFGAPAWWQLGEYVTLGKTFYNFLFEQEAAATPSCYHIFSFFAFQEKAFIRNKNIILCKKGKVIPLPACCGPEGG